ncbi:ABC transporter ATP-binding protein [Patescibacteria group bacterium]
MDPIIQVTNISKKYNITTEQGGYIALRDILTNIIKNPFRFAKNKAKTILGKAGKEEFWALKDINFSVEKGEAIGIIGANGAGKSTLLKVLTRITPPTEGEITMKGKVASLLEVGTGFHPELSGRENIALNGAILGMSKKEIAKKFNQIVEFSGIGKFIDTPVKRYSSGMYVRLAFSVAAHLEPDILLVDEVLAVGDAKFQKKCLGKMNEVTKKAGRTILFVSHNMEAIARLCKKCVLLEAGKVKMFDESKKVINCYLQNNPLSQSGDTIKTRTDRKGGEKIRLSSFHIESEGKKVDKIFSGGHYTFCFGYEALDGKPIKNLGCSSSIERVEGEYLVLNWTKHTKQEFELAPPKGIIRCEINQKFPFGEGLYNIDASLWTEKDREDYLYNLLTFEVKNDNGFFNNGVNIKSPIYLEQNWNITETK